jgi:hypothetical protein
MSSICCMPRRALFFCAVLLFATSCRTAPAADVSAASSGKTGYFFVFRVEHGAVAGAKVMATPQFAAGHAPSDAAAWQLRGEKADGGLVEAVTLSNPIAVAHADDTTQRLVARAPANPAIARWRLLDAGGRVRWSAAADARFVDSAHKTMQDMAGSVNAATGHTPAAFDPVALEHSQTPLQEAADHELAQLNRQWRTTANPQERLRLDRRRRSLLGLNTLPRPIPGPLASPTPDASLIAAGQLFPLTGKLRAADGTMIPAASLRAYRSGSGEYVSSTVSDTTGNYEIHLPAGQYEFEISTSARDESYYDDRLYIASSRIRNVNVTTVVRRDMSVTDAEHVLHLSITGTNVENVEVRALRGGAVLARPIIFPASDSACIDGAVCTLHWPLKFTPGVYDLRIEVVASAGTVKSFDAVDLSQGDVDLEVDATQAVPFVGHLVNTRGTPIALTAMSMYDDLDRYRTGSAVDANGQFSVAALAGWNLILYAPSRGDKAIGRVVPIADPATLPKTFELADLALEDTQHGALRRIYTGSAQDRIKILFLGDGYTDAHETYTDVNHNGMWDGYSWYDANGNGVFDQNADSLFTLGQPAGYPQEGGDALAFNEPFVDSNGDGVFSDNDDAVLLADARWHLRSLLGADYWNAHRHLFQADVAFVHSRQSGMTLLGSNGVATVSRDTAFGATLDPARDIISGDSDKILMMAEQLSPGYDYAVVLINQTPYSARGPTSIGNIPGSVWAQGGTSLSGLYRTLPHEFGHFVGLLWDEYAEFPRSGDFIEPYYDANVTTHLVYGLVPWKSWLDPALSLPDKSPRPGTGMFEGADYVQGGAYRPSWNSIMRGGLLFNEPSRYAMDKALSRFIAPVPAPPPPGNWFDPVHAGHGFDLQLIERNGDLGDLYFIVFYTYTATGKPDWYTALGRYVDGKFVAIADPSGHTLTHAHYDATAPANQRTSVDAAGSGSVAIDFRPGTDCGAGSLAGAATRGALTFTLGNETARWCIQPALADENYAQPNFSGHWYAPSDGGWGMEVNLIAGAQPLLVAYLYYPDAAGAPRWATASGPFTAAKPVEMELDEVSNGTCRSCAAPAGAKLREIGTLSLDLLAPVRESPVQTANAVTLHVLLPEGTRFDRVAVPLTLLSQPPGTY